MSYYLIKTVLGWLFLLLGLGAVFSMLTMMGKQEKKIPPPTLRRIHRRAGILFFLVMLVNAVLGFRFWILSGDTLSVRAVLHVVLALSLVVILTLKIALVKVFKNLNRFVPALGMTVFCLGSVVFLISGGYFTARSLASPFPETKAQPAEQNETVGDARQGEVIFAAQCASCHYPDQADPLFGPGLLDLFKNKTLPSSGRPVTLANVKEQIVNPYRTMPAFTTFREQEMNDLLAYMTNL